MNLTPERRREASRLRGVLAKVPETPVSSLESARGRMDDGLRLYLEGRNNDDARLAMAKLRTSHTLLQRQARALRAAKEGDSKAISSGITCAEEPLLGMVSAYEAICDLIGSDPEYKEFF